ncbi:hypothetical protein Hypma_007658 [Hypsizygus marmoreus]|uniref:Rhodopsin domain-containing protein n=1 Tax=Hypsizygus marmoreus TaxID=39966 RepID=A0A369JWI4_HYPMA|nr:hypothetical protein Hypma_007658 [Hypsizygus marmoreus]
MVENFEGITFLSEQHPFQDRTLKLISRVTPWEPATSSFEEEKGRNQPQFTQKYPSSQLATSSHIEYFEDPYHDIPAPAAGHSLFATMLNTSDPLIKIGITAVVCTIPAIATTAYRLWIRRGRYWADDAWALLSALSQFLMFSGVFIHITHSSPKGAMVAAYYLMAAPFYTVVWFARLSILFSIIRIDPSAVRRRLLLFVAALFFITTVVLVTQLFWVCEPEPGWKLEDSPQCVLTRQVVVLQIVTDVLADAILITAPLRLLRNLSDRKLRRRLTVIFSTCLITTVVSIVHAAFIFLRAGPQEVIAAIVEDNVSLIVCNVPVVVTSVMRLQRNAQKENASRGTALRFAPLGNTTTIGGGETATATTGWMNHFRWERDLGLEDESETGTTLSHIDIKSTSVQVQLLDVGGKPRPTSHFDEDTRKDPHPHHDFEEDARAKGSLRFQDG